MDVLRFYLGNRKTRNFVENIENGSLSNDDYRRIIHTVEGSIQLVYMSIPANGIIHMEKHINTSQFIRIEKGEGTVTFVEKQKYRHGKVMLPVEYPIEDGSAVIVPPNTLHFFQNKGSIPMKLYTIYSPPHHPVGLVQHSMKKSLELYDFIDSEYLNHLTLQDITQMKIGSQVKVVVWDRNVEEYGIWENLLKNEEYDAEEFFRWNVYTLTYQGNVKILLKSETSDDIEDNLHVDITAYDVGWKWNPLQDDGSLVIGKIKVPSSSIHPQTRVGFRGPMMLFRHLKGKRVFY